MFLRLELDVEGLDTQDERVKSIIPKGRHKVERISNPHGRGAPWLVLVGTTTGAAENYLTGTVGASLEI